MYYFDYLDEEINLLDMTRIPEEWYQNITKKLVEANANKLTTLNEYVFMMISRKTKSSLQGFPIKTSSSSTSSKIQKRSEGLSGNSRTISTSMTMWSKVSS